MKTPTEYELKQKEKLMDTYEKLKKEAEEKRASAEQQLIEVARRPFSSKDTIYFNALRFTICDETGMIKFYNEMISQLKAELIRFGVNV